MNKRISDYDQENPLGGPAKVFEAMALAIRAGDEYEDVLNQFGFAECTPVCLQQKKRASQQRYARCTVDGSST